jgi:hypothetical protein
MVAVCLVVFEQISRGSTLAHHYPSPPYDTTCNLGPVESRDLLFESYRTTSQPWRQHPILLYHHHQPSQSQEHLHYLSLQDVWCKPLLNPVSGLPTLMIYARFLISGRVPIDTATIPSPLTGRSGQPKTIPSGSYRQAGMGTTQVGSRVHGVLGVDRWIHELAGELGEEWFVAFKEKRTRVVSLRGRKMAWRSLASHFDGKSHRRE